MAAPVRLPPPPHGWPTLPRRLWWVLWVVGAPVVATIAGATWWAAELPNPFLIIAVVFVAMVLVAFGLFAGNATVGAVGVSFPFRTVRWGEVLHLVESDGEGRTESLRGSEPRTHVYVVDRRGRRRRLANLTGSTMAKVQRNISLVNYLNHHLRQHLEVPVLVFPVHLRADARIRLRYVGGMVYALLAGVYAWFTAADAPVAKWLIVGFMALLLLGGAGLLWSSVFERAVVTPDDLMVRGFLRRRRIPLDRVSHFQERPYQAHLVGGETVPLGGHDHAGVVPGLNQYLEHRRSGGVR